MKSVMKLFVVLGMLLGVSVTAHAQAFPFQTTCQVSPSPPYVAPQNLVWPWGQTEYCSHIPVDCANCGAANVTPCTPAGHETPGQYQVDLWAMDAVTPTNYYCARISVPAGAAGFHVNYNTMAALGWFARGTTAAQQKWTEGIVAGPGTAGYLSSQADVYSQGCVNQYSCFFFQQFLNRGVSSWMSINGVLTNTSLYFYRVGNSP